MLLMTNFSYLEILLSDLESNGNHLPMKKEGCRECKKEDLKPKALYSACPGERALGGGENAKDPLFKGICLSTTEGSSFKTGRKIQLDPSHPAVLCLPSPEEVFPLSNSLSPSHPGSWLPKNRHRFWTGYTRAKARRHQGLYFQSLGTPSRELCLQLIRQPFTNCFQLGVLYGQAHDPTLRTSYDLFTSLLSLSWNSE